MYMYICWAQSMDLDNPWIVPLKAWIHALSRQSMDCPHGEYSVRISTIVQSQDCMHYVRRPTWHGITSTRTRAREVRDQRDTQDQE